MSLLYGIKAIHPGTDEAKPHFCGYDTPRVAANSLLWDLANDDTSAGRKVAFDLNGHLYLAHLTAGDILYAVAGSVSGVKRLDSLAKGTAYQMLRMNAGATAPEWSGGLIQDNGTTVGFNVAPSAGIKFKFSAGGFSGNGFAVGSIEGNIDDAGAGGLVYGLKVLPNLSTTGTATSLLVTPLFTGTPSVGIGIDISSMSGATTMYAIRTGTTGQIKFGSLAGAGSRAVVADANGVLSAP